MDATMNFIYFISTALDDEKFSIATYLENKEQNIQFNNTGNNSEM